VEPKPKIKITIQTRFSLI